MSDPSRQHTDPEKTPGEPPLADTATGAPDRVESRRRFVKASLAAAPIILTIRSRPAWAGEHDKDKPDKPGKSAKLSPTHFSHQPKK